MWHIWRIDVGNELQADVYHDGGGITPAPRLGVVKAYRFAALNFGPQEIVAAHGDINRVEAEFEGYTDVIAASGSIGEIQASTVTPGGWYGDVLALNGSIGSIINTDSTIIADCIQAKNGIGTIWGRYLIHADIRSNANGGSGNLTTLRIPIGGDFRGSLHANTITGEPDAFGGWITFPVEVRGDFDGDAVIDTSLDGPWISRGLSIDRTITLRRNLGEDGRFTFEQFGGGFIDGQVIINADDNGYEWLGGAGVGEIGLANIPYYSNSNIGDGAIGLAPYHLHNEGCTPPNHGYIGLNEFNHPTTGGVVMRYYGPINIPSGGAGVVDIDKEVPCQPGVWMTDIDQYFSVTVNPSGVPGSPRAIRIRRADNTNPIPVGHYRVTIDDEGTQCLGVDGLPAVVSEVYDFWIAVDCFDDDVLNADDFLSGSSCNMTNDCNSNGVLDSCDISLGGYADVDNDGIPDMCETSCPCDWNSSGTINSQDFFDFIACFFGACQSGQTGDYNTDGVINSQDFFDFLNCLFEGC